MKILTLEDQIGRMVGGVNAWLMHFLKEKWCDAAATVRANVYSGECAPDVTVTPHINASRWAVRCPVCASTQGASRALSRHFCAGCGNQWAGFRWVRIEWPADVEAIEAALLARPDPATRNWRAPETVDSLRAENATRGVSA